MENTILYSNIEGAKKFRNRIDHEADLICTEEGFRGLQAEWTELYEVAKPRNLFLSYDWTSACAKHALTHVSLFVLTLRVGGQLVGVAPLRLERRMGARVLRFIADEASDYLGFLQAPDHPEVSLTILDHLKKQLRSQWDIAILRQLSDTYSDLNTMTVPSGLAFAEIEGSVSPYLALHGNWDEMYISGPSQLRHAWRWARKFEREGGTIEHVFGHKAVDFAEQISEIEAHSWKYRSGAARFQSVQGRQLLEQSLRCFGRSREMEVWIASMNGRPIAFLLNFMMPNRVWFYQGSYCEDYRKHYPGGVLHIHAIRNAVEEGASEYDFLRGDEAYKSGWTNGQRSLRYLAIFPDTLPGHLAFRTLVAPRWRLRSSKAAKTVYRNWLKLRTRLRAYKSSIPAHVKLAALICCFYFN